MVVVTDDDLNDDDDSNDDIDIDDLKLQNAYGITCNKNTGQVTSILISTYLNVRSKICFFFVFLCLPQTNQTKSPS